jgi:hypothetical protein
LDIFTIAWLGWGAYFAIWEGLAIFNDKKGDTLSEHVWRWFAVKDSRIDPEKANTFTKKSIRRTALAAFLGWLVTHFMTGGAI